MAQAKRDENHRASALAWNGSSTQPLKVDASTGRLLIAVSSIDGGSTTLRTGEAHRDENHRTAALAEDPNGDAAQIIIDSNGNLYCDVNQE